MVHANCHFRALSPACIVHTPAAGPNVICQLISEIMTIVIVGCRYLELEVTQSVWDRCWREVWFCVLCGVQRLHIWREFRRDLSLCRGNGWREANTISRLVPESILLKLLNFSQPSRFHVKHTSPGCHLTKKPVHSSGQLLYLVKVACGLRRGTIDSLCTF